MQFLVIKLSLKWQLTGKTYTNPGGWVVEQRISLFDFSRGRFLLMDNYTFAVLRSQGGRAEGFAMKTTIIGSKCGMLG